MVNFVWKSNQENKSNKTFVELQAAEKLKLKCISPHVAEFCEDLEERLKSILADYMQLGDLSLKQFLSSRLFTSFEAFLNDKSTCETTNELFLGRVADTLPEICKTIWKLLGKEVMYKFRSGKLGTTQLKKSIISNRSKS